MFMLHMHNPLKHLFSGMDQIPQVDVLLVHITSHMASYGSYSGYSENKLKLNDQSF